jgi:hypothetical protein
MDNHSSYLESVRQELGLVESQLAEARLLLDQKGSQNDFQDRKGFEDTYARFQEMLNHVERVNHTDRQGGEEIKYLLERRMEELRIAMDRLPGG